MGVLADDPLLLLFVVVGLGAALGRVRIGGIGLGPAAALFVGLAFSAVDADLANTPPIIPTLGLALFIYTIGLASGPSFVEGFRQGGARVVLGTVLVLGAIAGARAGLFAGTQTNTPALQASIEALDAEISAGQVTDPVVGYSIAYPFGVLSMIAAAYWGRSPPCWVTRIAASARSTRWDSRSVGARHRRVSIRSACYQRIGLSLILGHFRAE